MKRCWLYRWLKMWAQVGMTAAQLRRELDAHR